MNELGHVIIGYLEVIFLHVLNPQMKISLIFGIIHMTFGVMLSLWNMVSFFWSLKKLKLSNTGNTSVIVLMCS